MDKNINERVEMLQEKIAIELSWVYPELTFNEIYSEVRVCLSALEFQMNEKINDKNETKTI